MSLLTKAGITKLSELIIDADKDWNGKRLSQLKELALGMSKGAGGVLVKLSPGPISYELTSGGIHEVLRVTAQSDNAGDDGKTIAYDYMLEAM